MDEQYFNIEEAIAAAGVPTTDEQVGAPDTQDTYEVFTGEDVSEHFDPQTYTADDVYAQPTEQPQNITPEMARLLQQNQELLHRAYSEREKNSAQRIADLEAKLAAIEATKVETPQEKAWYETLDVPELTPEQQRQFAQSMPVIEAIATRKALEIAKQMDAARIDPISRRFQEVVQPLQESVQAQQQVLAATQQQNFLQALNARFPWLQGELSTPSYKQYYNSVVPGTGGLTRGALLAHATQNGDIDAIADLLSAYKPATKQTQQQYAAPGRSYAMNPTQATAAQPGVKKGMRLSTYDKALKDYSNGKMSPDRFKEYQAAWDSAILNGTATMD